WFLSSHGFGEEYNNLQAQKEKLQTEFVQDSLQLINVETELLEQSYIGKLGKVVEPVIKPLGFDWKIGIALITSFAAREVFVGTMATIYQSGSGDNTEGIKEKILRERDENGN